MNVEGRNKSQDKKRDVLYERDKKKKERKKGLNDSRIMTEKKERKKERKKKKKERKKERKKSLERNDVIFNEFVLTLHCKIKYPWMCSFGWH